MPVAKEGPRHEDLVQLLTRLGLGSTRKELQGVSTALLPARVPPELGSLWLRVLAEEEKEGTHFYAAVNWEQLKGRSHPSQGHSLDHPGQNSRNQVFSKHNKPSFPFPLQRNSNVMRVKNRGADWGRGEYTDCPPG